jgi:hypothetical protein
MLVGAGAVVRWHSFLLQRGCNPFSGLLENVCVVAAATTTLII